MLQAFAARVMTRNTDFPGFFRMRCLIVPLLLMGLPLRAGSIVDLRQGSLGELAAKASAGHEICIVTLGGSITQKADGHSRMIPDWFQQRFPSAKVKSHNAGLSSTCSHSGAFRFRKHVLDRKPDLLVVEFAVNDDQDARHSYDEAVKGMEGVVRQAHANNVPVLMILFVNDHLLKAEQGGEVAVSVRAHLAVADHYGVPTINVPRALARSIERNEMDWKAYGGVHPNAKGYRFVCGYVNEAAMQLLRRPARSRVSLPNPLKVDSFSKGAWRSPAGATFSSGWQVGKVERNLLAPGGFRKDYEVYPMAIAKEPGASLTFQFEGTAVGAFLLAGPDAGQVEVRVDGGKPRIVDLYHDPYSRGLHYPRTRMFMEGLESGRHTLSLKVLPAHHRKSKGTTCSLLYFAVNE